MTMRALDPRDECAKAKRDDRSWATKKWQAFAKEVRWRTYLLYCSTLYRPHMRLIHRYGKHWFTRLHPIDGPRMDWCQWCGERRMLSGGEQAEGTS